MKHRLLIALAALPLVLADCAGGNSFGQATDQQQPKTVSATPAPKKAMLTFEPQKDGSFQALVRLTNADGKIALETMNSGHIVGRWKKPMAEMPDVPPSVPNIYFNCNDYVTSVSKDEPTGNIIPKPRAVCTGYMIQVSAKDIPGGSVQVETTIHLSRLFGEPKKLSGLVEIPDLRGVAIHKTITLPANGGNAVLADDIRLEPVPFSTTTDGGRQDVILSTSQIGRDGITIVKPMCPAGQAATIYSQTLSGAVLGTLAPSLYSTVHDERRAWHLWAVSGDDPTRGDIVIDIHCQ